MAKKSIPRTCQHCGGNFLSEAKAINKGGAKFCNTACRNAYFKEHPPHVAPDCGEGKKRCPKCRAIKLIIDFYPAKGRRFGVAGHCKMCINARAVAWQKAHPEKRDAAAVRWNKRHPEKSKAIQRNKYHRQNPGARTIEQVKKDAEARASRPPTRAEAAWTKAQDRAKASKYYHKNKEERAAINKRWHERHPGASSKRGKRWSQAHPEESRERSRRRRLVKAAVPGRHSAKEWKDLCKRFDNRCVRCGSNAKLTRDHIVPVTREGSTDDISNIQPCCGACNASKGNRHATDYRQTPFTGQGIKVEAA